jgi:hypothetical protein
VEYSSTDGGIAAQPAFPTAINKQEGKDTMQRVRYIPMAMVAGTLAMAGWSSGPVGASAPTPTATGLPTGFSAVALGSGTTDTQSVSVDANGTWTIKAGGDGLTDTNGTDGGVGIYQKLSGNGSIIAHVASTSDPAAQVAVVFRQDPTDEASPILRNKYSAANLYEPEIRRASGDTPQAANGNNDSTQVGFRGLDAKGNDTVPGTGVLLGKNPWIGIDRNGPTFRFYSSNDGKVWNLLAVATDSGGSAGKGETVINSDPLYPADMQVGIEASKNTASAVSTITLDSVAVSSSPLDTAALATDANPISWLPRDKSVIVAWNPVKVAGATYNVYQFTKPNASDTPMKVNTAPITDSSFMVENLTDGNPYFFGVTAVVNGIESPMAMPLPAVLSSAGGIGAAVPNAPIDNGLQLYTFGTNTPGAVTVTGTGATAKYDFKVGGADFWEAGDGGSMLAMPMAGDLDVSLRLVQGPTDNGDGWAQGGPTFRQTLDPGSPMVIGILAANNPMQFKRRFFQNERPHNTSVTQSSGDNTTRPLWGRLVRKGNVFTGYYAERANTPAAADWKPMGDPTATDDSSNISTMNNIGPMPYVGMTWTAHSEGMVAEVVVDNVVIKPAQ